MSDTSHLKVVGFQILVSLMPRVYIVEMLSSVVGLVLTCSARVGYLPVRLSRMARDDPIRTIPGKCSGKVYLERVTHKSVRT